jgi:hypothetical protein
MIDPTKTSGTCAIGLLLVILGLGIYIIGALSRVAESVADTRKETAHAVMQILTEADRIMQLTASWSDSEGISRLVHTTQETGESYTDFAQRHDDAVTKQLAKYPA